MRENRENVNVVHALSVSSFLMRGNRENINVVDVCMHVRTMLRVRTTPVHNGVT